MVLRRLTVIALMSLSSPAGAEEAIRLFAPVPAGPAAIEPLPVEQAPAQDEAPIRLFAPVPHRSSPAQALVKTSQAKAPVMRGAVQEDRSSAAGF
jgi:hypothetical protein